MQERWTLDPRIWSRRAASRSARCITTSRTTSSAPRELPRLPIIDQSPYIGSGGLWGNHFMSGWLASQVRLLITAIAIATIIHRQGLEFEAEFTLRLGMSGLGWGTQG